MLKLIDQKDRMQAVADLTSASRVWYEYVSGDAGDIVSVELPESGHYRVLLVKLNDENEGCFQDNM